MITHDVHEFPGVTLKIPEEFVNQDLKGLPDVPGMDKNYSVYLILPRYNLHALMPEAERGAVTDEMLMPYVQLHFTVTPIDKMNLELKPEETRPPYKLVGRTQDGWTRYDAPELNTVNYVDANNRHAMRCSDLTSEDFPPKCHRYLTHGRLVIEYDLDGRSADSLAARQAVDKALIKLVDSWTVND